LNGSNWTEVNDLNTSRNSLAGAGTNTAALAFGGTTGSVTGATETWNGTNWTEGNDLNTARNSLAGSGISTLALAFGGSSPTQGTTEEYGETGGTKTITTD
jgi:hypothetical protein